MSSSGVTPQEPPNDFESVILYTDANGIARFRTEVILLKEGSPRVRLSAHMPATDFQIRRSPVGYRSEYHVSPYPLWVVILGGSIEIVLRDGTARTFTRGDHFLSADTVPEGENFNPTLHGHWSRQIGNEDLVTLFLKP